MAITTRTLGRTGADVTILGYGAMEFEASGAARKWRTTKPAG